ncbi:hypothetical protein D0T08_05065 [Emticicia sp. C21]|nr:hypothetical protein D0T08_05065 [Emticicia sp. C21]
MFQWLLINLIHNKMHSIHQKLLSFLEKYTLFKKYKDVILLSFLFPMRALIPDKWEITYLIIVSLIATILFFLFNYNNKGRLLRLVIMIFASLVLWFFITNTTRTQMYEKFPQMKQLNKE